MPSFTLKDKYITKSSKDRLYKIDTPIVGLTGGIATGKSSASNILMNLGHLVIDADKLVKLIYNSKESISFIQKLLPVCIKNNEIDFKSLREIFFKDAVIKQKIESYIYPRLQEKFLEQIPLGNKKFIIYDAPILFERGLDKMVDLSLLVYSPEQTQIERLVKRDLISDELAKEIIKNQISIEIKKKKADFTAINTSDLNDLETNLINILSTITV